MVDMVASPAATRAEANETERRALPIAQVEMLGGFRLYVAGRRIPDTLWTGSTRAKSLFQYLAYRASTPMQAEGLIETLWPDLEPEACVNTLHKAVHFLRQRLNFVTGRDGHELLRYADGCYTLSPDDVEVDAVAFRRALFQARWSQRLGDPGGQRDYLSRAIDLYQGELLADDYLIEWSVPERARLRHDMCGALRERAALARAAGQPHQAALYYRQLVAVDPTGEHGYQALIELALADGRRGEALRLYQRCQQVLRRELDLEPGPQIRSLVAPEDTAIRIAS